MRNIRALELGALLWVYLTMIVASLALDFFSHSDPFFSWRHAQSPTQGQLISAMALVVAYVVLTSPLARFFKWASELERIFRQILTPVSYLQILILAALSGFVEEWFFRGILLNHFGLVLSSLVFGASHFIPWSGVWIWSLMSVVMGYILGTLYIKSHSLILVALVHATINGIMLWRLNRVAHHRPAIN